MLKKIRIISQCVFFILFTLFVFTKLRVPAVYEFSGPWLLRLNPLVGLLTFIASHKILFPLLVSGIITTVLTLIFGRFFCGMICPLGAVIDFSDRFIFKKMRNRTRRPPLWLQKMKYVLLTALITMSVFGVLFPLFMDPILLITRFFALVVSPLLAIVSTDLRDSLTPLLTGVGFTDMAYLTVHIPLFYGIAGVSFLTVLVLAGGFFDKRFWCQYVCPSGALFGLLSRFAIFRRRVCAGECNSCHACTTGCPTRAISENCDKTSLAECIVCGVCTAKKKSCNSFGFAAPSKKHICGADIQRRHAVTGILGGLMLVPALRANASAKRDVSGRMIRPPGSIPEEDFLAKCISCGACMKTCPTNAIQPCTIGDGFQRIYTPKIVPRIGGCEEKCHACGYACPTGAIRKLPYEEKRFVKIGTAVINRHRCLAWEQNRECLVCDEVCPYNAITAKVVETTTGTFRVPVVNEDLCLGCGMCEQHCPITDEAAIAVFRFSEKRRATGPYATKKEKVQILEMRRAADNSIGASFTGNSSQNEAGAGTAVTGDSTVESKEKSEGESKLPPGFSF
jgi:MauM/NapG family ferredoxin protein